MGITKVQNKHGRDGYPREWNRLEGLADVALLEEMCLQVWDCGYRTTALCKGKAVSKYSVVLVWAYVWYVGL